MLNLKLDSVCFVIYGDVKTPHLAAQQNQLQNTSLKKLLDILTISSQSKK